MTKKNNNTLTSTSTIILFIINFTYSLIIKKRFNTIIHASINLKKSNI